MLQDWNTDSIDSFGISGDRKIAEYILRTSMAVCSLVQIPIETVFQNEANNEN